MTHILIVGAAGSGKTTLLNLINESYTTIQENNVTLYAKGKGRIASFFFEQLICVRVAKKMKKSLFFTDINPHGQEILCEYYKKKITLMGTKKFQLPDYIFLLQVPEEVRKTRILSRARRHFEGNSKLEMKSSRFSLFYQNFLKNYYKTRLGKNFFILSGEDSPTKNLKIIKDCITKIP